MLKTNYAPRDIFNGDETGLFIKAQPSKTLSLNVLEENSAKEELGLWSATTWMEVSNYHCL